MGAGYLNFCVLNACVQMAMIACYLYLQADTEDLKIAEASLETSMFLCN